MIRLLKNNAFIVLMIFLGCKSKPTESSLPFINKPDFTPEWINKSDAGYSSIHHIPAFSFTNQNGETITEKTVEGKIYVADFIFTRCGSICPKMTNNMGILQSAFKNNKEVLLLSHSVTPDMDSVPVLKKYAEEKGIISDKWHLLTGKETEIYDLAKKQYFAGDTIGYYQTGNEFLHTENFILVDKLRRIRGVYNGTLPLEMERLTDDINTLLKENQ
ncbi:MAG: SCO family protein [Chitinophagaceae bacterium]|nr:SCO family protein [Chitinophagaceae bacterium]